MVVLCQFIVTASYLYKLVMILMEEVFHKLVMCKREQRILVKTVN